MKVSLRVVGYAVFGVGLLLLVGWQVTGEFALLKWGALVGFSGMILTYLGNMIRIWKRAGTPDPRLRGSRARSSAPPDDEDAPGNA